MAGAISINVAANVRDAVRGVDSVADAVEEVSDRLHDMTKDSDQTADRLERDFREVQRSTDKTSDDIKRKFRDAYKSVGKSSDDAADDAVRAQRRMSEQSEEFGQEIRQNLGEGIANAARGDFESLADTIGDTLGGAVAGIGGIGTAAAAAAGAAGLGLVIAAFNAIREQEEARQQRIAEWAAAYIEASGQVISAAQIAAKVQEIASDPERYKQAAQNAKDWGVDESTAMRAIAGDASALAVVRDTLNARTEEANRLLAEQEMQVDSNAGKAYDLADAVNRGAEAYSNLTGEMREGASRAANVSDALKQLVNDAGEVTEEVDELGNKLYTLPDQTQVFIDAETGIASQNVSRFKGDLDGLPQTKDVFLKVRVDRSEWDNWRPVIKQGYVATRPVATSSGKFWE